MAHIGEDGLFKSTDIDTFGVACGAENKTVYPLIMEITPERMRKGTVRLINQGWIFLFLSQNIYKHSPDMDFKNPSVRNNFTMGIESILNDRKPSLPGIDRLVNGGKHRSTTVPDSKMRPVAKTCHLPRLA